MNPNTRTVCIEVLLNEAEETRLDKLRGGLGRSPYFRTLLDGADQAHGMPPARPKESRGCRGVRPANRHSVGLVTMRRQV